MYLTQAEADAKGLPSVQEQIDRHNAALRIEALASDAGQCFNCGLDHVLFFGASKCPRCGEGR